MMNVMATTETTASSSSNIPNKPSHSCMRCAERKVKCDRKNPCGACVRHDADCVFKPSQPPRNRRKRLDTQILNNRLKLYEALLREKGMDPIKLRHIAESEAPLQTSHAPAAVPNETQVHIPPLIDQSRSSRSANEVQIIHGPGRVRFVNNILWTGMVQEFRDLQDALGDSSNDASEEETSDDDFGFVFDNQIKSNAKSHHPPPQGIDQLWEIFVENVDPLTKVVHVPTLRTGIEKAATNTESVPRGFEALMFAIYSAAVMSLNDDECQQRLNESRKVLLSCYVSATKAALSRARFMENTSLVVLQALVIHLLAVRDIYEPRAIWCLTGVAVRIAQGMGIDRDGESLGLPPFETEMRRRIWWQLKMHDFRTAELCGIAKFHDLHIGTESPKWPTNVNDDQLYPDMASMATESTFSTDAVFISVKCELLNSAAERVATLRRQGKTSDPWDIYTSGSDTADIDKSFREIEELLETKYLRYCDPSQPLELMAMLMARCSINVLRFLSHHPRRWTSIEQSPLSERQWIWKICLKLLEQQNMLQSNPHLRKFAWHAPYFQQWHAIIHVLDTLQANPLAADADKAWKFIGSTYENNPEMIFDMRRPIHIAVSNLCLRAYGTREAALKNGNTRPSPAPHFIMQLREQRGAIKARKQARHTTKNQIVDQINDGRTDTTSNKQRPRSGSDTCLDNLSDTLESTGIKSTAALHATHHTPGGTSIAPERDSFGFTHGFGHGQIDDINNGSMEMNFMLYQDYLVEDNATHTITWDQWDSWLTNSNTIRPLSSSEDFPAGGT